MPTPLPYIHINRRRLYLDPQALACDEVQGFDGDDEQCEECGKNIVESSRIVHGSVWCACNTAYVIYEDEAGGRGPLR